MVEKTFIQLFILTITLSLTIPTIQLNIQDLQNFATQVQNQLQSIANDVNNYLTNIFDQIKRDNDDKGRPTTMPSPKPTPTPKLTPNPTPMPSPTPTPHPTPRLTPTATPSPTPMPSPTLEPTPNPMPSPTVSPTPLILTPQPTATITDQPTAQPTRIPLPTPTQESNPSPTPKPTPNSIPEPYETENPSKTQPIGKVPESDYFPLASIIAAIIIGSTIVATLFLKNKQKLQSRDDSQLETTFCFPKLKDQVMG